MTALCNGGASQPKVGAPEFISDSADAIAAALALTGFEVPAAVAALIAPAAQFVTQSFCSKDPPADPGIGPNDIMSALLITDPSQSIPAINKIAQWFLHSRWWDVCECAAMLTPAQPTPSSPGNPVGTNTGLPTAPNTSPCWNVTLSDEMPSYASPTATPPKNLNQSGLPQGSTISVTNNYSTLPDTAVSMPAGVNNLRIFADNSVNVGSAQATFSGVFFYDSSGAFISEFFTECCGLGFNNPNTLALPPSNAAYWLLCHDNLHSAPRTVSTTFSFFCSGQSPTGLQVPCCPPDPIVNTYLQTILTYVQQIQQNPGNTPVTRWTDGAQHPGLSGNGTFQFSGPAIGVRWDVTTPPANPSIIPGQPNFYWDMGFVTPISIGTPLRGNRLVYLSESFILPPVADGMDYTLLHGTVATATELLAA